MSAIETWWDAGTRWIRFDRPDKLNALTVDELRAVTDLLSGGAEEPEAVVFTGTGERAFSAGMHVDSFVDLDPDGARALITAVRDCVAAARTAPCPTVAEVGGYCLGAAFELALACDVRVVAEHAAFGLPEIRVGVPSVVDAALLQQHVGLGKAKEMILTGEVYPVAALPGLAGELVPAAELRAATRRMLARLTGHSKAAVAAQKRLFETWQNTSLAEGIEASVEEFAAVFADPGTARAVQARRAHLTRSGEE
ncbi:enoyl-CoA hydratase/isomerase family protein [Saccharopolyspora cebuensis]|uniref:enoyl-CoA hydratase/isomerase family protein n=1 Tax=Saccharopolyspora cebuensis TaxID=418759 RepID=UPI0031E87816